ncbi:hypothetical protein MtrunA17_Chr5g0397961 [Medicago truncatula]|nr:hypothetical protein MtrunA17_Chr5g0397961 [Medicago truncatula]
MMFGLFLAIFPTVLVLLWLLHQKGLFDPLYDWWEDICGADEKQFIMDRHRVKINQTHHHIHDNKHRKQEVRHLNHRAPNRRKTSYEHNHKHKHSEGNSDYFNHLHHVQKETHKHRHRKHVDNLQNIDDNHPAHHKHRKEQDPSTGLIKDLRHDKIRHANYGKHKQVLVYDPGAE